MNLKSTRRVLTERCFRAENIWHRNGEIAWKLPRYSEAMKGGVAVSYGFTSVRRIFEAVEKIMGSGSYLKQHTFSLGQIEEMMDGWLFPADGTGNYFLVQGKEKIMVVDIRLFGDGRWAVYVRDLREAMRPGDHLFDIVRFDGLMKGTLWGRLKLIFKR